MPGSLPRAVAIVAAVALVAALGSWPYGYYQLLRVIVCGAGIYCGWMLWAPVVGGSRQLAIAAFVIAALFNPFLPVHLTREIWAIVDLIAAAIFGWIAYRQR